MSNVYLKIIRLIELYIKKDYKKTIADLAVDFTTSEIMSIVLTYSEIEELINENHCYEPIYYYIEQIKLQKLGKVIPRIYDKDIFLSFHPEIVTIVPDAEIRMVFRAMRNNLTMFERLYANKVYEITTSLNQKIKINITSAKLFHLFGMSFRDFQKTYRKEILAILPELNSLLNMNYVKLCSRNDPRLLEAIKLILSKEEKIINEIKRNENFAKVFPVPKMLAKNFAFERLGLIESPTGIVIYDKAKDPQGERSMISSDFFILRDFIMDYQLRWIFNGYNSYGKDIKNAETLLLEKDTSNKFINQTIAISSSILTINKSNLDFNVRVISELSEFSLPSQISLASKLIESFPNSDLDHLKELVNQRVLTKTNLNQ